MNQNNIVITSDSTTDLSPELIERYNISTIPLGVTLGDRLYTDGIDVTPDDLYEYFSKTGQTPKTSAPNVGAYDDFFQKFTDEGKTVIHFTISSSMSSSYNNACLASQDKENVYVIDTANLSTGGGLLMLAAADMAESGMAAEEIVKKTRKLVPCVDASFVIDSLEYLYRGGRCSALSMLGANLLKIKPCIQVKNGSMGICKKYRGKYEEVLKQYISDRISDCSDICLDRVFITHAGCAPKVVDSITELVKNTADFKEVFVTRAGSTISSHCGANTLGILFIRKSPIA